jgi:hypothetical protein
MTQRARDEVLERAMVDAAFRSLLSSDPVAALADYDLTPEERAAFHTGTVKAERLEERMSKSDLSSAMAVKTSSPMMKSPSEKRR